MIGAGIHLIQLYLPLLTHAQREVRRQAYIILTCTYGEGAIAQMRALLQSLDPDLRQQARLALQNVAEFDAQPVVQPAAQGLQIMCLGTFRVEVNGYAIQPGDWAQSESGRAGGQKVKAVLAYLVHCGRRGATREALGEAVWGKAVSPSSFARTFTALRQTLVLSGAEELIERALVLTNERCILNPEHYSTDAATFERTFDLACQVEEREGLDVAAQLYAQALDLYGGPYMVDVVRGNGWMQEQRDMLAGNFIIATERIAEHTYSQGKFWECIKRCEKAIDDEPSADDLMIWLLRSYAQLDLRFELEHAYQRYLRAAHIDPQSDEAQYDPVVDVYHELKSRDTSVDD